LKQEQLIAEYGRNAGIPYVVVRPGSVYGGSKTQITGRVGLSTFGLFLHLGGSNRIPFTYVENCADAIVLAGAVDGVNGEAFNVVDDDLPTSRHFLGQYKRNIKRFRSVYVPHAVSHALCYLWETYAKSSTGQLPAAFSRKRWHMEWKKTEYSNEKLKTRLGWNPKVPTREAMARYFQDCRQSEQNA
jgi:nucleoside-diphosphate-sugar epimerase